MISLMVVQQIIVAPMILHTILNAFLLFFFLICPSSKMGTTNQIQSAMMIDIIIYYLCYVGR